jgi:hypothetical protein
MSGPVLNIPDRQLMPRNSYDKATVRHLDRLGNGVDHRDGEPGAEGETR